MKTLLSLLLVVSLSIGVYSCKEGSGTKKCDDASVAWSDAVLNYASTPNTATCNALKSALLELIDVCDLEQFWNQYGGQGAWEDYVDDVQNIAC